MVPRSRFAKVLVALAVVVCAATGCGGGTAGADAAEPRAAPSAASEPDSPPPAAGQGPATAAGQDAGTEGPPYCGPSRLVAEITLQSWPDGAFRVSLRPTEEARRADDRDEATEVLWQAIQRCLRGTVDGARLSGTVGESLRDQLRCHEYLALIPAGGSERYATGDTFDLESWRPVAGRSRWISTRCGNTLGTAPAGTPTDSYRPDGVEVQRTISGEHE